MREIKHSAEFLAKQRDTKEIRKDISTAYNLISDALARYKKKKLHAKSKKQLDDMSMFAELEIYSSKLDIQDTYGWGTITEATMYRLWDLWDAREIVIANNGKYEDRVTKMLERAMSKVGEEYFEQLSEFDDLVRRDKEALAQIERDNSTNTYNRYKAGL